MGKNAVEQKIPLGRSERGGRKTPEGFQVGEDQSGGTGGPSKGGGENRETRERTFLRVGKKKSQCNSSCRFLALFGGSNPGVAGE